MAISSVAVPADFDKDGDLDLFVGGRVISKQYGDIPPSFLLVNNGKGKFEIAKENIAEGLGKIGMVTDATWTDKNNDGWPDLVMVGEWMPVTIYINDKGILKNKTADEGLEKTLGLWQSVKSADLDNNGFADLLLGNWGENSKLKASESYPLKLYVGDVDKNGDTDQVLAVEKEGKYYTFHNKEDLEKQFTSMVRKQYESYGQMAGQTISQIFPKQLNSLSELHVNTLSSALLWNSGKKYAMKNLPAALQFFPVFAWSVRDFDNNGTKDVLAAGNFYGVIPFEGRYDAGYGQIMLNKNNQWHTPAPFQSGLKLDGEIRSLQQLKSINNRTLHLVAKNDGKLAVLELKNKTKDSKTPSK